MERFSSTGAYLGQFNGTGTYEVEGTTFTKGAVPPQGQFTPGEQGLAGLAVDSSSSLGDPSKGDVYVLDSANNVVDKFSATGEYEGQLEGRCGSPGTCPGSATPFFRPFAVTVDPSGNVWVAEDRGEGPGGALNGAEDFISEFSGAGDYLKQIHLAGIGTPKLAGIGTPKSSLAVDADGYLYEILGQSGPTKILSSAGSPEFGWGYANGRREPPSQVGRGALGLGVEPSAEEMLVAEPGSGGQISEYNLQGELSSVPLASFGAKDFQSGWNGAFESLAATNDNAVYVTEPVANELLYFDEITLPDVTAEPASSVSETSAVLHAVVNPDGEQVTTCEFEYGVEASYTQTVPCGSNPGAGTGIVPVSAEISGLSPDTTYDYRVRVGDASGVNQKEEVESFTTLSPLIVGGESFSDVGPGSATFAAEIDPGGRAVEYSFEYGTSEAYGSVTPSVELEHGHSTVNVHTQVSGLGADTLYYFRVVAHEEGGASQVGAGSSFRTYPLVVGGLPDGRVYELVTPVDNYEANVVQLEGWPEAEGPAAANPEVYRASPDGDSVAYQSTPTAGGNGQNSNQQLATRSPGGGWTQVNVQPRAATSAFFTMLSDGLEVGIVGSGEPLVSGGPGNPEVGKEETGFYVWQTGVPGYRALPGTFVGESPDGSSDLVEESGRLYEVSTGGVVSPVGVLPEGQLAGTSTSPTVKNGHPSLNWISTDGSRVVWTSEGFLYLRDMASGETVQLDAGQGGPGSGGGRLWTASADGSRLFFTSEEQLTSNATGGALELYECRMVEEAGKLTCKLSDLTAKEGESGNVLGVLGTSENGEYVYFVASAALATGANPEPSCERFEPVDCNLYMSHDGETRFIAVLSEQDQTDWANPGGTAEVSASGSLVFVSYQSLTGYENMGSECYEPIGGQRGSPGGCSEVYVYDSSGSGHIFCASCNPSGEPPAGNVPSASYLLDNGLGAFQTRWISEDGDRVFFNSGERLVARDTNGLQDVYEWEKDDTGGCARQQGCISLLSSGTGTTGSYLIDASASGDDVFIASRDLLVQDGQKPDNAVYDVRVGGVEPLTPPACSGTGCQGTPAAPPIFATPASVTFNGVGNFTPQSLTVVTKPKTKTKAKSVKCKKGTVKKHGKCAKKAKGKKASSRKVIGGKARHSISGGRKK